VNAAMAHPLGGRYRAFYLHLQRIFSAPAIATPAIDAASGAGKHIKSSYIFIALFEPVVYGLPSSTLVCHDDDAGLCHCRYRPCDWGRKELAIAETEMPGLMAIRAEFGPSRC